MLDAQQDAFVENLMKPLMSSKVVTAKDTEQIMSELNLKMKMDKKEGSVPTNPHWVM